MSFEPYSSCASGPRSRHRPYPVHNVSASLRLCESLFRATYPKVICKCFRCYCHGYREIRMRIAAILLFIHLLSRLPFPSKGKPNKDPSFFFVPVRNVSPKNVHRRFIDSLSASPSDIIFLIQKVYNCISSLLMSILATKSRRMRGI